MHLVAAISAMTTDEVEVGLENGNEHPSAPKEQTVGIELTADASVADDSGAQVHYSVEQISFTT